MLLFFLELIASVWKVKVPAVFLYSSTRMLLAAITTFLLTILLGPRCIKKLYEMKTGQSIRVEDCPQLAALHQKKKDTPTMGGILILFTVLLAAMLWMDFHSSFTWILMGMTVALGCLGGYDDYLKMKLKNSRGISAKKKFGLQVGFSLLVALYLLWPVGTSWITPPAAKEVLSKTASVALDSSQYIARYYVPFLKDPLLILQGSGVILGVLFTAFVITGTSNAVNLTDGLDGLAAGCVVMSASVLAIVAFLSNNMEISRYLNILYIEQSGEIGVYLCALIGACLGFLWYNGYPAQVFMGDTGSLALGGILGTSAVLLRREVLLAIVGGVFVAEALSVILQVGSYKLRNRRRVFLCAPLHHHFEYKGWPETKVVLRFWLIALILAMMGLISLKFQ